MLHTSGFPSARLLALKAPTRPCGSSSSVSGGSSGSPGAASNITGVSAHWVLAELIARRAGVDFRDYVETRVTHATRAPACSRHPRRPTRPSASTRLAVGEGSSLSTRSQRAIDQPADGAPCGDSRRRRPHDGRRARRVDQGLLHNSAQIWDDDLLREREDQRALQLRGSTDGRARTAARSDSYSPVMMASTCCATRSSGRDCSPVSFGHAGANAEVAWADPATGLWFVYLSNAIDSDVMRGADPQQPVGHDLDAELAV